MIPEPYLKNGGLVTHSVHIEMVENICKLFVRSAHPGQTGGGLADYSHLIPVIQVWQWAWKEG